MFIEEDIVIKDTSFDNVIKVFEKNIQDNYNNYKNCSDVDESKLYISEIYANQGTTMKRIQPRAQGRANRIRKRTSHITVVLQEA